MSKGFKIICQECKSEDCIVEEDIDYDWDENPVLYGYYVVCNNCGNQDR